ncbi:hypothetical protein VQ042_21485 [Aurantimonas sp. A2-1-M11]|uniref:hypothetical protein n=1 Tax=Aurantimonas sp. A2-1-M11 TaxID=3113712 RepID=UPI002F92AD92
MRVTPIQMPDGARYAVDGVEYEVTGRSVKTPGYKVVALETDKADTHLDTFIEQAVFDRRIVYRGKVEGIGEGASENRALSWMEIPEDNLPAVAFRMQHMMALRAAGDRLAKSRDPVRAAVKDVPPDENGWTPCASTVLEWRRRFEVGGGDPKDLRRLDHKKGNRTPRKPDFVVAAIERALDECRLMRRGVLPHIRTTAIGYAKATVPNDLSPYVRVKTGKDGRDTIESLIPRVGRTEAIDWEALIKYENVRDAWLRRTGLDKASRVHGSRKARRMFKAVLAGAVVDHVFQRGEVDHTRLRWHVVDDVLMLPLGIPWASFDIDVKSRCIVGTHVGFDPPSEAVNAQLMKNAMMPKDLSWMGKRPDGRPYVHNNYPMYGKQWDVWTDQGADLLSKTFKDACYRLGTKLNPLPPGMPEMKPYIEAFNRRLKASDIGHMFAWAETKPQSKGPKKTRKQIRDTYEILLTLTELRILITTWIVDGYHLEPHHELGVSPQEYWFEHVGKGGTQFPPAEEDLVLFVGGTEIRSVHPVGIKLWGLKFNCDELGIFRGTLSDEDGVLDEVTVKYDPACIDHIWAMKPDPNHPGRSLVVKVPCTRLDYARGLSLHAHKVICRFVKDRSKVGHLSMTQLIDARLRLREIAKEMLAERDRNGGRVRVARYLGIGRKSLVPGHDHYDEEASREDLDLFDVAADVEEIADDDLKGATPAGGPAPSSAIRSKDAAPKSRSVEPRGNSAPKAKTRDNVSDMPPEPIGTKAGRELAKPMKFEKMENLNAKK